MCILWWLLLKHSQTNEGLETVQTLLNFFLPLLRFHRPQERGFDVKMTIMEQSWMLPDCRPSWTLSQRPSEIATDAEKCVITHWLTIRNSTLPVRTEILLSPLPSMQQPNSAKVHSSPQQPLSARGRSSYSTGNGHHHVSWPPPCTELPTQASQKS